MEVEGSFSLSRPKLEGLRSLSFSFQTKGLDLADRHQYVPKVLPAGLKEWIADSLLSGELLNLQFAYHGQGNHVDYLNSRRIELMGDYADLNVNYFNNWPMVSEAEGRVHLRGKETTISVAGASTLGIERISANFAIDHVLDTLLGSVEFTSSGNGVIPFILNSPLKEELSFLSLIHI